MNPDAPKGTPTPPRALKAVAKAEWDRMVARLTETGAISTVDDAALYQYVQLFAETEDIAKDVDDARRLSRQLKDLAKALDGRELVTVIDRIVHLQTIVARSKTALRQGHMAIRQYLVEFGLTPSARSRVKLPAKKTLSRVDAFNQKPKSA